MATKKPKNPYENLNKNDPFNVNKNQPPPSNNPLNQSRADNIPSPGSLPNTPSSPINNTEAKINRDDKGDIQRIELPDGRSFSGLKPSEYLRILDAYNNSAPAKARKPLTEGEKLEANFSAAQRKKDFEDSKVQPNVSNEFLANLGTLNAEQLARANSDPTLSGNPGISGILKSAGEKAAAGAAGAAAAGAVAGSVVPVLGTLAGAGLGALGGAITGATYGTFAEYKAQDKYNLDSVNQNLANAQYNINQAITQAQRGGDPVKIKQAYGDALAELRLIERQYKSLSKDPTKFDKEIKLKMQELENYNRDILPDLDERLKIALLSNPQAIVDTGLDAEGNPIGY